MEWSVVMVKEKDFHIIIRWNTKIIIDDVPTSNKLITNNITLL